jgi:hypothetical protein
MTYEIWSVPTGNLVATYPGEAEAWAAIRLLADRHGPEYLLRLALTREGDDGRTVTLATGPALTRHLGPQFA